MGDLEGLFEVPESLLACPNYGSNFSTDAILYRHPWLLWPHKLGGMFFINIQISAIRCHKSMILVSNYTYSRPRNTFMKIAILYLERPSWNSRWRPRGSDIFFNFEVSATYSVPVTPVFVGNRSEIIYLTHI